VVGGKKEEIGKKEREISAGALISLKRNVVVSPNVRKA